MTENDETDPSYRNDSLIQPVKPQIFFLENYQN